MLAVHSSLILARDVRTLAQTWYVAKCKQSIHYDMEDLIEQANEIQESLGRSYGVPDEVDEADLQAGKCAFPIRATTLSNKSET
jgi:hypothetical protein